MVEVAVELSNVRYCYPDGFIALDDVSLRIMRGERVAILGANGAGKSTLLMLMSGLFVPSKGKARVLGVDTGQTRHVRRSVGIVFQDPDDQLFCPTLSEDIAFGPLNMGLSREDVSERVRNVLRLMGLEGYEDKAPHHLSVGEKKRAAVAAVLAMTPEILVLDEPAANLDSASRSELVGIINRLNESGTTIVTATHEVNMVPAIADRVYVMSKGRIVAYGPLREIFSNQQVMSEAGLELPTVGLLIKLLTEQLKMELVDLPLTTDEALHVIQQLMRMRKH